MTLCNIIYEILPCLFILYKKVRSQLSKNDRKKFNAVLIVDVHNRDIIDRFVRDRQED